MQKLIERTRRINELLQRTAGQPVDYSELADTLCSVTNANVYIADRGGALLGHAHDESDSCPVTAAVVAAGKWETEFNRRLLRVDVSSPALAADDLPTADVNGSNTVTGEQAMAVVPIFGADDRLGTIVLGRRSGTFGEDDLVLAELGATVAGMELLRSRSDEAEDEARRQAAVQVAVSTLSYSELGAVQHIFDELGGSEGLVVASKIADRVGITRSVIVNALRKFESAGVIESRSLGMKGTYIRVLNEFLLDELRRRRF